MHVAAFSADAPAEDILVYLTPIADSVLSPSGTTGLLPSRKMDIVGLYAGANLTATPTTPTLVRAQPSAPTFIQVITPAIQPLSPTAAPDSDPPLQLLTDHPLPLPAGEALTVQVEVSALLSTVAAVVFLREKFEPLPPGPMYTLRGVASATTPTSRSWTQIAITWAQQLPAGRCAIAWIQYIAPTGTAAPIAARLVLPDQVLRPGALAQPLVSSLPNRQMQDGVFGLLGTFESFAMPTVEVLQIGAAPTATGEIHLGLIRLTDAAGRPCRCS